VLGEYFTSELLGGKKTANKWVEQALMEGRFMQIFIKKKLPRGVRRTAETLLTLP